VRILLFCIVLLTCPLARGAEGTLQPVDPVAISKLEQRLTTLSETQGFRGTVLIASQGEMVFRQGYGKAVIEHNVANSAETRFKIGSVSKQFTAAAILALEESGTLRVTDKLSDHIDATPEAWAQVTIHNLLTHTSGIPNWFNLQAMTPNYPEIEWTRPYTLAALTEIFKARPLDFEPGTRFNYSNPGYTILAHIVEKRSGMNYHQYLADRIFARVPMPHTSESHHEVIIPNLATGYYTANGSTFRAPYYDVSIEAGAGELISTVDDLLAWIRALQGNSVLSEESRIKMMTPFLDSYAYGLVIGDAIGRDVLWHNGWVVGFRADVSHFVADDLTIIVLSNQNDLEAHQISMELAAIIFDEDHGTSGTID
jgi:CubicO group peptidase (beta-lactamase class C family)